MKIEDMAPIALLLLVTGIVLGIGADVLTEVGDEVATFDATAATETSIVLNSTATYALVSRADRGGGYGSLTVRNESGAGELLTSANYTFSTSAGTLILVSGSSYNNTACNLTYTYDMFSGIPIAATENATKGMGEMASWFPTIALVLAAAIIIGLVVGFFRTRRD